MQIALVKRQPKRRCRIPRRPHPGLDYFFSRLERSDARWTTIPGPTIRTSSIRFPRNADTETASFRNAP